MSPLADTSHFRLPSHHSSQMFDNVFSSNAANMAMDAVSFMHPYRHFQWICRSLLMLNRSILRQLPKEYCVSFDADQFLSSMTMELDGERRTLDKWLLAPDSEVHEPSSSQSSTTPCEFGFHA